VWWKNAAISAHHGVAFWRGPEAHAVLAIPLIHYAEFGDVARAREYRVYIGKGGVPAVKQAELIVR